MSVDGDTTAAAPPHVVEELFGVVQLLSDGSVIRSDESALLPREESFPDVPGVEWKDVVYHAGRGLKVRVYRPSSVLCRDGKKLPIIVYFHGGGYCIGSFDEPGVHAHCRRVAAELPAVVLSAQYRLAPEHRLPAAIDDGAAFLSWLRTQAVSVTGGDPWLAESAVDYARTFVSGVSAGANLAHHVVVNATTTSSPVLRVAGYVLLSAFFGGAERTATEREPPAGTIYTLDMFDKLWAMALPVGASRDHPVSNPFGEESPGLERVELPPALVVAPGTDVLRDRVLGYAKRMREMGKTVELVEFEGEQHGFSVVQPFGDAADELMRVMKRFVYSK